MNKESLNLSDNLSLFFDFINESSEIIFIINKKSQCIEYSNITASKSLGYSQDELRNKHLKEVLEELDLDKLGVGLIRQKDNLGTYSLLTCKNDKILYARTSFTEHTQSGITYVLAVSRDITEKIKNEIVLSHTIQEDKVALENQKIFSNTLINNAPSAIFYKNSQGEYLGVNKAWEELTGLLKEDVIGKSVYDIAPKEIAEVYAEQDDKVFTLEENPQVYQWKVKNVKKNETYEVIFYKSAYFDNDNNVIGLIGIVIDITDVKQLEKDKEEKERLIYHQSKMASMGEMLENIAHQWRQPLSIISTSASGIQMQQQFDVLTKEQLEKAIEDIVEASFYLSHTIDDFRYFFKTEKKKNHFKIQEVFERTLKLLSSKFENNDLTLITDIESASLFNFENELTHVVINILNNASDILKQKELKEKIIKIDCFKQQDNFIIQIQDNGGGVPNDIINRIFEPYFTTKHQSQGTGIGLYMSQEIVSKHLKGKLYVKNQTFTHHNKTFNGALFTIQLPLQKEAIDYSI